MKNLKILSVDCEVSLDNKYGIKSGAFWQQESFSEYDVLIIDPIDMDSISKHPARNSFVNTCAKRRPKEIEILLKKTGGIVICFLRENYGDRYVWLPSRVYTESELTPSGKAARQEERTGHFAEGGGGSVTHSGEDNSVVWQFLLGGFYSTPRVGHEVKYIDKTSPFSQYFEAFKNEISFEVVFSEKDQMFWFSKIIAKDRGDDVIAFELPFGPGKIVFLPPLTKVIDKDKFFGVLLDCIKKSLEWTEPLSKPDWLKKYPLDEKREKETAKDIGEIEKKIENMLRKKQKVENERKKVELLKALLYEQGKFGLEPPVREAFRILEFNVLESDDYDLYIKEGNLLIIGEVEGSSKAIHIEKLDQLNRYVSQERIKGNECKGILIGNGYIEKEPDKREEQFTNGAITACKSLTYCRMTTYELFKAVKTVLCEPNLKQNIKEQILSCESEFKL